MRGPWWRRSETPFGMDAGSVATATTATAMAVGCGVWDGGPQGYMMPQHGSIISVNTNSAGTSPRLPPPSLRERISPRATL